MKRSIGGLSVAVFFGILGGTPALVASQPSGSGSSSTVSPALSQALRYRMIGPFRGGRSTAVAGIPSQPYTYYMGTTGGGVWKTTDGGLGWDNISDGFFKAASIGAVAASEWDPNVVYVGTGSACIRGNVSPGIGIYKSTDAGQSWKHTGLEDAGQIGRIRIHPQNQDLVYVAALGHAFGPNAQRGVFRSKDGGKSWEKVLYVSDKAGAVDLAMDATNPRVLYATIWRGERKPWLIISGGEEGGLYKTADGGDTWEKLSAGLPTSAVGKMAVAVSPANPSRVWVLVEAEAGGLYRSDDGGKSFQLINSERPLQDRAWYYIHVFADPQDENTVYVLNTRFYKSIDGGRTFAGVSTPHGDNHDLWINPNSSQIMVQANDGGGNVSYNGGQSWSTQLNQPTAELYRLAVDNQFPYRVYGSQQDNSTISLPSRVVSSQTSDGPISASGIHLQRWLTVGGCESGHVALNQANPNIVYAGCYGGIITRVDVEKEDLRIIMPYPQLAMGMPARDLKYRFQWTAPIRVSPHDPKTVYFTSQFVHKSTNEGQSWEIVSPDLTRNDKEKQDHAGTPFQWEGAGAEVYDTIFAFEESKQTPGLLWSGTDDGLVQVSRDGGRNWENVTPKALPQWATVNMLELSAHDPGRAFLAAHNYRLDDFKPYVFRTNDYGKSWELLTDGRNGIPANHFVRVVREDPDRKGLLYAGTEFGMYVSFDDGRHWQPLQLNLPATPVTDMLVHQKDLVLATQGRSFWILDNLTPLHQLTDQVAKASAHLFKPRDTHRLTVRGAAPSGGGRDQLRGAALEQGMVGENAPVGAMIFYSFAESPKAEVKLEILDSAGRLVRAFSSQTEERRRAASGSYETGWERPEPRVPTKAGLNLFIWDLHHPGPYVVEGASLWRGTTGGPRAVPGTYQVRLISGSWSQTQSFEVQKDPRIATTQADFQEQLELLVRIRDTITKNFEAVREVRDVREQVNSVAERLKKTGPSEEVVKAAQSLSDKLTEIESELMQVNTKGTLIINPPKLGQQLVYLYGIVANADARPTREAGLRYDDLKAELGTVMGKLQQVLTTDLTTFNNLARGKGAWPVLVSRPTL